MKDSIKTAVVVVGVWALSNWAWDKWGRDLAKEWGLTSLLSSGDSAGSSGGSGGSSVSSGSDYGALASAIAALAAGVQLPNIQTATVTCAAGNNELVASEGGKRACVLAFSAMGAGANSINFRSGNNPTNLWGVSLDSPAGNSGANLATAWPGYLFATSGSDALVANVSAAAVISVTYWKENV